MHECITKRYTHRIVRVELMKGIFLCWRLGEDAGVRESACRWRQGQRCGQTRALRAQLAVSCTARQTAFSASPIAWAVVADQPKSLKHLTRYCSLFIVSIRFDSIRFDSIRFDSVSVVWFPRIDIRIWD